MATYELWDERSNQSVGRFPTQPAALHLVRELLEAGDVITVAALVLRLSDWATASTTIASGSELVALARLGTGDEWMRRRSRDDPSGPRMFETTRSETESISERKST